MLCHVIKELKVIIFSRIYMGHYLEDYTTWTMYASVHHGAYRRKMLLFVIPTIFINVFALLNSVKRETVHCLDQITCNFPSQINFA